MSAIQTKSERPKSLTGLLPIINRWKYHVLGLTLLAFVASVIISLILPNVYKSTTVFYPTNLATLDPDQIMDGNKKIEKFGTREDIDRITTIGLSQPVADYIIYKYKLYKDYGFEDMTDDLSKQAVLDNFIGDLNIVQTERDAIELTFYSEDKHKAAAIANDMVNKIDQMNYELTLENQKKILHIQQQRYDYIFEKLVAIRDSLSKARKKHSIYGLVNEGRSISESVLKNQTDMLKAQGELEVLSKSLSATDPKIIALKAQVNGLEKAVAAITKTNTHSYNLEGYMNGIDQVTDLELQFRYLRSQLSDARKAFDHAKLSLTSKVSTIYVVQKAYPAMKKAKPIRWLIVVSATVLTFVLSVIFVALLELYYREMRRAAA
ncbi:GumC domain-containing protein [Adhaeribacter soli]|uniref:Polysaccharide chain length determinant N-terminal domain-containing protein n=1 Tax=Adhaeribacter soli TaxID=2607655 RepID=A0A5N1J4J9_9BACT|nr:hypothetical protein [Adhaeribacter soli]KAA9345637.1 hypothetical protein F0P94_00680 [Adhaeribacter soli]